MAETVYTFRVPHQNVIQRDRARVVSAEIYRGAELAVPSSGTYSLLTQAGVAIVDAQVVTVTDGIATYSIAAVTLPSTLELSTLYTESWALVMPDGTRTFRRECAIARHELHPAAAMVDLTKGEYPELVDWLGDVNSNLQDHRDEAWAQILEKLWADGRFPQLMLSASALRQPLRHLTFYLAFKRLFAHVSGAGLNRFKTLMDRHYDEWNAAWSGITSRIDHDMDGLPDTNSRESTGTLVHRNAHRYRTRSRDPRW